MEQKTPLYQTHVDAGGKIVEFGGFLMPVQYPTGVIAEHMAVREKAGLFDVSHMGELRLKGPDAVSNVQKIITADVSGMQDGDIKYAYQDISLFRGRFHLRIISIALLGNLVWLQKKKKNQIS